MSKKTNKEITLDDLALMVAKGFGQVDKRFEQVDKRFGQIEKRLGNIEADLNKKVDKFTHNDLVYRVEKLEKKYA